MSHIKKKEVYGSSHLHYASFKLYSLSSVFSTQKLVKNHSNPSSPIRFPKIKFLDHLFYIVEMTVTM